MNHYIFSRLVTFQLQQTILSNSAIKNISFILKWLLLLASFLCCACLFRFSFFFCFFCFRWFSFSILFFLLTKTHRNYDRPIEKWMKRKWISTRIATVGKMKRQNNKPSIDSNANWNKYFQNQRKLHSSTDRMTISLQTINGFLPIFRLRFSIFYWNDKSQCGFLNV